MSDHMDRLFFYNFPFKTPRNHSWATGKWTERLPSDKPYVISTAHNKLDLSTLMSHAKINKLKTTGVDFYLYEVLASYTWKRGEKVKNRAFYNEIDYTQEEHDRLYCDEFDAIQKLAELLDITINVYTCDYNVNEIYKKQYNRLNLFCFDVFLQSVYRRRLNKWPFIPIVKKFHCPNWRYTPARHAIMCYLANKEGHYSWYFNTTNVEFIKVDEKYMPQIHEGNKILNDTKFEIDHSINKTNISDVFSVKYPNNNKNQDPVWDENFYNSLLETFVSIVTETRFAQPTGNFSEKTYHTMYCKRPFVLVAPPFTLQYMHKLGYKTFDKWWSEDYDTTTDHFKRMEKIFDIIDYINSLDLQEMQKILEEMEDIFLHNLQVIDYYKENFHPILR